MEDKATITYAEMLATVEEFMVGSGIRKFCSEICKGECCRSCQKPCDQNEGRRLNCSVFVCGSLELYLKVFWRNSRDVAEDCYNIVHQAIGGRPWRDNPYYTVHTPGLQACCNFQAKLIEAIPPREQWPDIANRLDFLADQTRIERMLGEPVWYQYSDDFTRKISGLLKQYEQQHAGAAT